ncbi:triacylglycerol lipase, partial [Teladorsagia circumcincta]
SFIIAVRQYTGTQVDIVAYSMGAPIARKAILGGNCMDTREILGPPLTELIDTFVSVAGANHGSVLCVVPIPVGTCNRNYLIKGENACKAKAIDNITKAKSLDSSRESRNTAELKPLLTDN